MIKFILFLVFLYFTFRFIFSLFGLKIARMAAREAVKGARRDFSRNNENSSQNRGKSPEKKQVEDIDYEEIN